MSEENLWAIVAAIIVYVPLLIIFGFVKVVKGTFIFLGLIIFLMAFFYLLHWLAFKIGD